MRTRNFTHRARAGYALLMVMAVTARCDDHDGGHRGTNDDQRQDEHPQQRVQRHVQRG